MLIRKWSLEEHVRCQLASASQRKLNMLLGGAEACIDSLQIVHVCIAPDAIA